MMKQKKIVKQMYQACLEHNHEKEQELIKKEFEKIFKHQEKGKKFGTKWTIVG